MTTKASTSNRSVDHSQTPSSVKHSPSQLTEMHSSSRSTFHLVATRRCSVDRSSLARTATAMSSPARTTQLLPKPC